MKKGFRKGPLRAVVERKHGAFERHIGDLLECGHEYIFPPRTFERDRVRQTRMCLACVKEHGEKVYVPDVKAAVVAANALATVVNLRRRPYQVYIGRANPGLGESDGTFGNPFHIDGHSADAAAREECIQKYARYLRDRLLADTEFRRKVLTLKGKVLGCWCMPKRCHGEVLVEWLNRGTILGEKVEP